MSTQTGNVSFVTTTGSALRAADNGCFVEFAFNRFKAAPTVADTSVSRQTGLAGMGKRSSDPASLTLTQQSGLTSKTITNTLVVRPRNCCAVVPATPVRFGRVSSRLVRVNP